MIHMTLHNYRITDSILTMPGSSREHSCFCFCFVLFYCRICYLMMITIYVLKSVIIWWQRGDWRLQSWHTQTWRPHGSIWMTMVSWERSICHDLLASDNQHFVLLYHDWARTKWPFCRRLFTCIFLIYRFCILLQIRLKYIAKRPVDHKSTSLSHLPLIPYICLNELWQHWFR